MTGSNGKTTVKEMLAAILTKHAGEAAVLATRGNLNNDIGLPLTLLGLRHAHRWCAIELGINHKGEIAYLAGIARPTVALVNNAQREHLEFMRSVEEVAAVVRIARQFRVPLYPLSTGMNWGLGSRLPVVSGAVVVDLRRMNAIRALSSDELYATVEPGVTQAQVDVGRARVAPHVRQRLPDVPVYQQGHRFRSLGSRPVIQLVGDPGVGPHVFEVGPQGCPQPAFFQLRRPEVENEPPQAIERQGEGFLEFLFLPG